MNSSAAATNLPNGWSKRRLFDLCQFIPGKAHEPFIDPLGEFICVNSKFISTEGEVAKTCNQNITPARTDDVLLVMSDLPNGRALAKCYLVEQDELYAVNQRVCILRPRTGADPKMLIHVLNRNPYFLAFNDGVNQTHLLNSVFEKCELAVPDEAEEQKRIGSALSDADALIEALERLIAKKRLIKQGAMQDLLTAKRRLPGFSGEWVETSFGQCFQFLRTGSASRSQLGVNLGVGYIHYGDIHGMKSVMLDTSVTRLPEIESGQVETLSRVRDGDLVIADASEDLADVGKSVEVRGVGDKQIVAGLHTFLLRGNPEIVADGFKAYIQFLRDVRAGIENIATGSSVYGISKKNLAGLKFRVPPVREQAAIGQMFADMDAEIQILDTRLEKARQVKDGMMQNLLTGRIRLV